MAMSHEIKARTASVASTPLAHSVLRFMRISLVTGTYQGRKRAGRNDQPQGSRPIQDRLRTALEIISFERNPQPPAIRDGTIAQRIHQRERTGRGNVMVHHLV